MTLTEVFLVDGVRTPIGRYGQGLAGVRPDDMLARVLSVLVARTGLDPRHVDEVVTGDANQSGEDNRDVARMALLLAGYPIEVPGLTVNRLCASGLAAITSGFRSIASGEADVVVASGVESMSRAPYVLAKAEKPFRRGAPELADSTLGWRFVNPELAKAYPPVSMGETAENLADQYEISRADQDEFALTSHRRSIAAWDDGFYDDHVVEVAGLRRDEGPRTGTTLAALAALPAVFRDGGSVTAGNSSTLNDGAGAVLLCSAAAVERHGLTPLARIVGTGQAGVHPSYMGIGPVPATRRVLDRVGWSIDELDVVEINEAFAAQVLAVVRELKIDLDRVNTHGGAIALGHPLGMSGIRLVLTAVARLRGTAGARRAMASACVGVGQGETVLLEAL